MLIEDQNASHNIQNYWVFGLFPSSGIPENKKHDISEKLDLFPSSGEGGAFK
jgi:hypothetical protein